MNMQYKYQLMIYHNLLHILILKQHLRKQ